MNTIGGRQILSTFTLLLPKGETASVEVPIGQWRPRFEIAFADDPDDAPDRKANISVANGTPQGAQLLFKNFTGVLQSTLEQPMEIGRANSGEILMLMISHMRSGSTNRIDLQFLLSPKL